MEKGFFVGEDFKHDVLITSWRLLSSWPRLNALKVKNGPKGILCWID